MQEKILKEAIPYAERSYLLIFNLVKFSFTYASVFL